MKLNIKRLKALLAIAVILAASSCTYYNDFEFSRSVFTEDYDFPGLPIYSELGYNTFGMYIDRKVFSSTDSAYPIKIIVNEDTCKFSLNGWYSGGPATLGIALIGFSPEDYPDLIQLNDSIINLDDPNCILTFTQNGHTTVAKKMDIIQGSLHIKQAKKLYIDTEFTRVILSGTIALKTFLFDDPVAFTNGRFDLGVGYENFYNY